MATVATYPEDPVSIYYLRCHACGATCSAYGTYEDDTNATCLHGIDDGKKLRTPWEGGDPSCPHEDTSTTDIETDNDDCDL